MKPPALPYPPGALAPFLSKGQVACHFDGHECWYFQNLPRLLKAAGHDGANESLPAIIGAVSSSVNAQHGGEVLLHTAAQAWNHVFYWEGMTGTPQTPHARRRSDVYQAIVEQWGAWQAFAAEFVQAGVAQFGSGWVWLLRKQDGRLIIAVEPNEVGPFHESMRRAWGYATPLLVCDVWEHAYYLDYRDDRTAYLRGFLRQIDWNVVDFRAG